MRTLKEWEEKVEYETKRAREKHRSFASWHEAHSVIAEELEEFWESIRSNMPDVNELAQVAACCRLAALELSGTSGEIPLDEGRRWA